MKRISIILIFIVAILEISACGYPNELNNSGLSEVVSVVDENEELYCGLDIEAISMTDDTIIDAVRGSTYVWENYGHHGLFTIYFNDDYTYESCTGDEAYLLKGNWMIDEYRILAMYEEQDEEYNGRVNYFEVCPCVDEGVYRLDYLPGISDGFEAIDKLDGSFYLVFEYDYVGFENLLGEEATYIYYAGTLPLVGNYYLCDGEICLPVWGTNPGDVTLIDLDSDGRNEMIASVIWGDGVEDVVIYMAKDDLVMRAYGRSLFDQEYEGEFAWALLAEYIPDTNQIKIAYWEHDNQEYKYQYYDLVVEDLKWEQIY